MTHTASYSSAVLVFCGAKIKYNRHLLKPLAEIPSGVLRSISALGVRIPLYAIGRN